MAACTFWANLRQKSMECLGNLFQSKRQVLKKDAAQKAKDSMVRFNRTTMKQLLRESIFEVRRSVKTLYRLNVNDDTLSVIFGYLNYEWTWKSLCDCYDTEDHGLKILSQRVGGSSWNTWAYTDPFPETGVQTIKISIDHKRPDAGWIGIGVIRKRFVEVAKRNEGGFKIYSKHAIFVDPSWNAHEPHFNLLSLDVDKQNAMKKGDTVTIRLDNENRTILFFCNNESEPFAEGDWSHLNYEPICGYAILTSKNDALSIVVD